MEIIISAVIVALLVGLDQLTKFLAELFLKASDSIVIIDNVIELTFSYNTGAAFSMFENFPYFPLLISIIGVIVIPYFFKFVSFKRRPLYTIALMLVYAGTWGNFIDRLLTVLGLKEGVVDFFNFLFRFYRNHYIHLFSIISKPLLPKQQYLQIFLVQQL